MNLVKSSSLFRTSGIYTIAGFINAAIPLFLLPILTRKLTPSDYGIVAMFQLAVSIIYPFMGMNLDGAIARKYYDKDNSDLSEYIGTCLILFLSASIIVALIIGRSTDFIQEITQIPKLWIKYVVFVAACQFMAATILINFQIRIQPIKYGILQTMQSLINIGTTIYLVIILNRTWDGRIEAQIITGFTVALFSVGFLYKNRLVKFRIHKKDVIHALRFGIPLIPHALGGIFFTAIDRFFLTNLIGLEQTGNYSVAYQLGAIVGLVTIALNNAFVPWLFENLKKDSFLIKKQIVKWTYLYFVALLIIAVIILLILPLIINIFIGKSFNSINTYTFLIVFGFVFQGMYYMVTNYIAYANKTYLQALATISIAIIKIPITYFSILWFGAFGASLSYCLTFFLFFVLTWKVSSTIYKMPWALVFKELVFQRNNLERD